MLEEQLALLIPHFHLIPVALSAGLLRTGGAHIQDSLNLIFPSIVLDQRAGTHTPVRNELYLHFHIDSFILRHSNSS